MLGIVRQQCCVRLYAALRQEVPHPFIFSVPYTIEWQNLFPFAQNCDKAHFVELRNAGALDGLFFVFIFSQTALVSHGAV